MSSEPIRTDVSWLFGSTGGTTPMPRRARIEKDMVLTGIRSYSPLYSVSRRWRVMGSMSPSIFTPSMSSKAGRRWRGIKQSGLQ